MLLIFDRSICPSLLMLNGRKCGIPFPSWLNPPKGKPFFIKITPVSTKLPNLTICQPGAKSVGERAEVSESSELR
jgi:hypothetical protein